VADGVVLGVEAWRAVRGGQGARVDEGVETGAGLGIIAGVEVRQQPPQSEKLKELGGAEKRISVCIVWKIWAVHNCLSQVCE